MSFTPGRTKDGKACKRCLNYQRLCWQCSRKKREQKHRAKLEEAREEVEESLEPYRQIAESEKKLTDRQERFAQHYVATLDVRESYCVAGYTSSHPKTPYRIRNHPRVKARIEELLDQKASEFKLQSDRIIYELWKIARSNMGEYITVQPDGSAYVDLSNLTPEQASAIQEITTDTYIEEDGEDGKLVKKVKVKLYRKEGAIKLLGKHLGLFEDRVTVTHETQEDSTRWDALPVEVLGMVSLLVRGCKLPDKLIKEIGKWVNETENSEIIEAEVVEDG